jgi:hypothetical protein
MSKGGKYKVKLKKKIKKSKNRQIRRRKNQNSVREAGKRDIYSG